MACRSPGSWKAAVCFVFHQSALNQRAPSVLESWDAHTKGRRDGMKEERKVGRKKKEGEDLSVRSSLIKGFLWTWTGSTWMHMQWAIAYIALQHRILLFILKRLLWLTCLMLAACYLPREQKKHSSGACSAVPTFPLPFCEHQQMTKAGKRNFDLSTIPHQ